MEVSLANAVRSATAEPAIRFQEKIKAKTATASISQPINAHLIGPWADSLMIGGASILVFVAYWLFVDSSASETNVGRFAFYLSFLINSPHFASSYQLLYGQYRGQILKKKSFFWASIVAPAIILGAIIFGIQTMNREVLAFLAQAMYLSVGWHYVKQIFGVSLVTSTVQKRYFSVWERNIVLINLYCVWAMSWVSANIYIRKENLDGIAYLSLGLPETLLNFVYAATAISFVAVLFTMLKKYIQTGVRPAYSSMVGFITIYVWYIPAIHHPLFFFVIPFFHSLQYMLFVYTIKKNQAVAKASGAADAVKARSEFVKSLWGFMGVAVVLGALMFEFVPKNLDKFSPMKNGFNNPTMWMFAIALFINLHHYFIDNVIWRGDNEFLKENLIRANQAKVTT